MMIRCGGHGRRSSSDDGEEGEKAKTAEEGGGGFGDDGDFHADDAWTFIGACYINHSFLSTPGYALAVPPGTYRLLAAFSVLFGLKSKLRNNRKRIFGVVILVGALIYGTGE